MRAGDIAMLSTRMFKTNPSRTWLTVVGMGVGTGAVVALVGLGFGLQGIILERIVFGETLLSLNVTNPLSKTVVINQEFIDELTSDPMVKEASPKVSFQALATINGLTGYANVEGMKPSFFLYS